MYMPLQHVYDWGWATIPIVFFNSWALLGIEVASLECERPVHRRANHLTMDAYCVRISKDVLQSMAALDVYAKLGLPARARAYTV